MALLPIKRRRREGMTRFPDEFESLLDRFFGETEFPWIEKAYRPIVDIADKDGEIVVNAEIPGCDPKDIELSIHGNTLTLKGEKKDKSEIKEDDYYHMESYRGTFRRDMMIPSEVDADKIEAKCKDGVLTIKMPKTEKEQSKKIDIES